MAGPLVARACPDGLLRRGSGLGRRRPPFPGALHGADPRRRSGRRRRLLCSFERDGGVRLPRAFRSGRAVPRAGSRLHARRSAQRGRVAGSAAPRSPVDDRGGAMVRRSSPERIASGLPERRKRASRDGVARLRPTAPPLAKRHAKARGAGPGPQAGPASGRGQGPGPGRARRHSPRAPGRLRPIRQRAPSVDIGLPRRGRGRAPQRHPVPDRSLSPNPGGRHGGGRLGLRAADRRADLRHSRRLDDHGLRGGTPPPNAGPDLGRARPLDARSPCFAPESWPGPASS